MMRQSWNPLYALAGGSSLVVALLILLLPTGRQPFSSVGPSADKLFLYCAAGLRAPTERVARQYEQEYGVQVDLQYGGSNTLLSQIEVGGVGDLYLAADAAYIELAQQKQLAREAIPVATMHPVVAVAVGNPKGIHGIADLWRDDVAVALANPDQAAVGKLLRNQLTATRQWQLLRDAVRKRGVFKPTVGDVANDVKLGSVDAGVLWDAVAAQYPELETVVCGELNDGQVNIEIAVLSSTKQPTAALHFARYLAAQDRGLETFGELGYEPVDGDPWEHRPELTLFAGVVNRRALEPIVEGFAAREGADVVTVYNGCGILTAQMKTLEADASDGFPDAFMACDTHYMDVVSDFFPEPANVSNTRIVMVVEKGNPKRILRLEDLAKPGVRLALGQPQQCTIGVLSRRLLEHVGLYERLLNANVVTQTTSSALLIPSVLTGGADVALVYETDVQAERERLGVIPIESELAKAVQPFGVAAGSNHRRLSRRLLDAIGRSQDQFEAAGFNWLYDDLAP